MFFMQRELSPIENAINTVTSKTRELQRSIEELKEDDRRNINPLSMQLKGVIDAAVNGGIVNYKNVSYVCIRVFYKKRHDKKQSHVVIYLYVTILLRKDFRFQLKTSRLRHINLQTHKVKCLKIIIDLPSTHSQALSPKIYIIVMLVSLRLLPIARWLEQCATPQ